MPPTFEGSSQRPPSPPPGPPPAPAGPKRDQAPPPPRGGLPWGLIGTNSYRYLSQGRGVGVRREDAGQGVEYRKPPLPPDSPAWIKDGDAYEMPIDGPAPEDVKGLADLDVMSLVDFRRQLEEAADAGPASDAFRRRMRELDTFADRLLAAVEHLHAHGSGVGLIRPPGVLLRSGSGGLQVILPDLGFVRSTKATVRYPSWLTAEHPQVREWRTLWDDGDLLGMQELAAEEADGTRSVAHDLRKVARLLMWLLLGKVRRTVPQRDEERSTHAAVWNVLAAVLDGKIRTAAEFRTALQQDENRPSLHFQREPAKPRGKGGSGALTAALAVLLLAAAGGGGWWAWNYLNPAVPIPDPDRKGRELAAGEKPPPLPQGSRLEGPVKKVEEATTPEEVEGPLEEIEKARPHPDPEAAEVEELHKQEARRKAVALNGKRLGELMVKFWADYDARDSCREGIATTAERLKRLLSTEKRDSQKQQIELWLNESQDWLAQDRVRFSLPPTNAGAEK